VIRLKTSKMFTNSQMSASRCKNKAETKQSSRGFDNLPIQSRC